MRRLKLCTKRYVAATARCLIGITISLSVVAIATPALLMYQIKSLLHIERGSESGHQPTSTEVHREAGAGSKRIHHSPQKQCCAAPSGTAQSEAPDSQSMRAVPSPKISRSTGEARTFRFDNAPQLQEPPQP